MTYKNAGVNIDTAKKFIKRIKKIVNITKKKESFSDFGNFSSLFQIPKGYCEPILVSSTDGVGTKLCFTSLLNKYDSIGIDLVAMCVNDLLTYGAKPLFFLDYYSVSKLNITIAEKIIDGISKGCIESNCSLVGGETAEMPDLYQNKDFDLAGFSVGIVEKSKIINKKNVKNGDIILALQSNGLHSNGYSLVRKIIKDCNIDINTTTIKKHLLKKILLNPTKIYVKIIHKLIENNVKINAIAHITGGGLIENIPRVLPINTQAIINQKKWKWPNIFTWLKKIGDISNNEMYRTFNCGIGMIIIVNKNEVKKLINIGKSINEKIFEIGMVKLASSEKRIIIT
ncbi:phosphoribosylformylglycinamidine cyclo-ligase [Candidatus Tachikawaea gelatinosa]|uniref:Phosphoribosylformylglycinamidine cyclo-ligase n=1 Tax=Candidatus Tachikawaea gelatinosa TaxID=1410383 RepID=A0A090AQ27_9ENTR|nr:phosphoribosylformylglycinamidine cyclo-ligase [Candidatus Tachikawaea gelatinosa]BAP58427.1 phosphoribosylformylglycinamidine cyclo-ligase [Candidatus Tachikawaea gelatinosa]